MSRRAVAAIAGVSFALSGCASSSASDDLPDHLRSLIEAAPAAQQTVIGDGEVSFGDVERAADAVARCLRDQGMERVSVDYEPPDRPGLVGQFGWTMAVVDVEAALEAEDRGEHFTDESDLALDRCYDEHFSAIGALYNYLNTDPRVAEEHLQDLTSPDRE